MSSAGGRAFQTSARPVAATGQTYIWSNINTAASLTFHRPQPPQILTFKPAQRSKGGGNIDNSLLLGKSKSMARLG